MKELLLCSTYLSQIIEKKTKGVDSNLTSLGFDATVYQAISHTTDFIYE